MVALHTGLFAKVLAVSAISYGFSERGSPVAEVEPDP